MCYDQQPKTLRNSEIEECKNTRKKQKLDAKSKQFSISQNPAKTLLSYLLKLKRKCHLPPDKTQRLASVLHSLQRNDIRTLLTMVQFFNCWV